MPHLQPTVRQLQPLGRRYRSEPVMRQQVVTHARAAETTSPDPTTSVAAQPRRRRWLTARASPSS